MPSFFVYSPRWLHIKSLISPFMSSPMTSGACNALNLDLLSATCRILDFKCFFHVLQFWRKCSAISYSHIHLINFIWYSRVMARSYEVSLLSLKTAFRRFWTRPAMDGRSSKKLNMDVNFCVGQNPESCF